MLKKLFLCAASLLGCALNAETIGDVEFQFPPSNCEWKVLFNNDLFDKVLEEEDAKEMPLTKCFAHREGDALELLVTMQFPFEGDSEEDEEEANLALAQEVLDVLLNQYLPNHRLHAIAFEDHENSGLLEWEFRDDQFDIMHGYSRVLIKNGHLTVFSYVTTAPRSECNRAIWVNTLNQAQ